MLVSPLRQQPQPLLNHNQTTTCTRMGQSYTTFLCLSILSSFPSHSHSQLYILIFHSSFTLALTLSSLYTVLHSPTSQHPTFQPPNMGGKNHTCATVRRQPNPLNCPCPTDTTTRLHARQSKPYKHVPPHCQHVNEVVLWRSIDSEFIRQSGSSG